MVVSEAEIASLAATPDIIRIGMAADDVRREKHGRRTTFVRVAALSAQPGSPSESPAAAGELRIAGEPASRDQAVARVREVVSAAGGRPVSAFSLARLEHLATIDGAPLRTVLEELRDAGLELVAEAPYDRLQRAAASIEAVNIAGLALGRLTIDKLPAIDPVALFKAVADLQRAVGVIRAFAPLPRRVNSAAPTTGYDDVRRVALARIIVDQIPSIQVDWALYGPKLAQVALTVGADDLDAVSPLDDTSEGRRRAPLEEVRRNIRAAGLEPVERNGRFDIVS